jgi:hypothetical protein
MTAAETMERPMRETQPRRILDFFPVRLLEAEGPPIDGQARTARVCIISEGLGNVRDRNFYLPSAITSAVKVFEGKQFYVDHPAKDDDENRPERSVRDLAGYFFDCAVGAVRDAETGEDLAACFATLRFAESDPGRLAFEQVKTALEYQRQFPAAKGVYAGISINADGTSHPGVLNGMQVNMVTEIREAFSADIVTKPARGGKFLASARESVVGSRAAVAARVAAWQQQQPQRARIGLLTEGTRMSTITVATKEATDRLALALGETARPKVLALGEKLQRLGTMTEASGVAMALLDDIQQDFAQMKTMLMGGASGEVPSGDTPPGDAALPDAGTGEAVPDGMDGAQPGGATDMTKKPTDIGLGGRAGGGQTPMKYNCEGCGKENEVLPPEGYQMTPMGEAAQPGDVVAATPGAAAAATDPIMENLVAKLQRQLHAKETRFAEANQRDKSLLFENIKLRAEVMATNILREAGKAVREAEVPPDILSAGDLVAFQRDQWPVIIKAAKGVFTRETADLNLVGSRPGVGRAGGDARSPANGEGAAVTTFKERYTKGGA